MADENKQVHFVKDSLIMHKASRSQEWLNWGIRVVMAKNYIDNLREESMKGWAEKLAQGWLPAPPPPGYMTITQNGKRIHVPDPATKSLMIEAFKKYTEPNHSIASIAKEMRMMGITTRRGRPYFKSQVQKILTNPFYIGINRFDGKEYPGAQETFISKELFERVQRKMHNGRPMILVKHNPVLKGLIRCEDCSTIVTWQMQKGRYYGACRRRSEACKAAKLLREDQVEEAITTMLERLVCPSPAIIEWVADTMRSRQQDTIESQERLMASIQTQINRLQRMDDSLYDDKLAGNITQEKYDEKHAQFTQELEKLNEQLARLDRSSGRRLEHHLVLLELSQRAARIFTHKSPEQKRLIVSKLFGTLTLRGGSLSVTYTNFAQAIAEKVVKTSKLMEDAK